MSTEILVGGTVVNQEEEDEKERLCLIGSSVSAHIFYAFYTIHRFVVKMIEWKEGFYKFWYNGSSRKKIEDSSKVIARFRI